MMFLSRPTTIDPLDVLKASIEDALIQDAEDRANMTTPPFDITKCQKDSNGHLLCKTRDGRKARIVCHDLVTTSEWVVVAAVLARDGEESIYRFNDGGFFFAHGNPTSKNDLINIPERIKRDVRSASDLFP
jgi:hypothetical protein